MLCQQAPDQRSCFTPRRLRYLSPIVRQLPCSPSLILVATRSRSTSATEPRKTSSPSWRGSRSCSSSPAIRAGNDAHATLELMAEVRGGSGIQTEVYWDGFGAFLGGGRVDILSTATFEIWDIKPNDRA